MAYNKKYKFLIDSTEYDAIFSDSLSLNQRKDNGRVFLRESLSGQLTFKKSAYNYITGKSIGYRFDFEIQKWNGTTFVNHKDGYFYKTDCFFNEDRSLVEVGPTLEDGYESIIDGLDKEFDLFEIGVPTTDVNYVKQPLIQIYFAGETVLTSYINNIYFEQETTVAESDDSTLTGTYKFNAGTPFYYIPGTGIDVDVSGIYDYTTLQRSDGVYELHEKSLGGLNIVWTIREVATLIERYVGNLNEDLTETEFQSTTSTDECRVLEKKPYGRVLTDLTVINSSPTSSITSNDIVSSNYLYVLGLTPSSSQIVPFDGHSTTAAKYGKFEDAALNFAGEYFTKPIGDTYYPIGQSLWTDASMWLSFDTAFKNLQEDGAISKTIKTAYKLEDLLNSIVKQIDSNLSHDSLDSSFLYDATNPISSETNETLMIIPKRFIVEGNELAKGFETAKLKLSELLVMLKYVFNVFWHLDSNDLKLEHIKYYEKGKHYTTNQVAIDFTTLNDAKTGKPYSTGQNKYTYAKDILPERIDFNWMDKSSVPFEGYPIEMTDDYVQKGNIQDNSISLFSSDIDYIQAVSEDISKDGFVIVSATGTPLTVSFEEFTINANESYKMQNGRLSLIYLHNYFHKNNLPSTNIKINGTSTTSDSTKKGRIQNVSYPKSSSFDSMELVTTGLGTGEVIEVSENLTTEKLELKVHHGIV